MVFLHFICHKCFRMSVVKVNSKTANALANQQFYREIFFFDIRKIIGQPFDCYEFLKFCKVSFIIIFVC